MSKQKPSVLIIGAGVSGIAAAAKLHRNGIENVTILEAENRIGGRVYSVPFGGSIADLGGQWVHGEQGNIVYEMVKNLDLLSSSFNDYKNFTFQSSNGNVINKVITDRIYEVVSDIMNDEDEGLKHEGNFGDYFSERFTRRIEQEFKNDPKTIEISKLVLQWCSKFMLCMDCADSWHKIATRGAFYYKPSPGNQQLNWRDKGYATILKLLMKDFPENKVLLNKEVKRVKWEKNPSGVTVECSDSTSFNADYCIVTTSLGVLQKYHKTMFEPQLPSLKVKTIENMSIGGVKKILLKFPTKWWPDDFKGLSLCWEQSPSKSEVPHFEPSFNGKSWVENIFGFYVVDSHPKVLLWWVVGPLISEIEELPDRVVIDNCMFLLRKFTGGKYDIPAPDGILRSKWVTNPHFLGTFTYDSMRHHQSGVKREDLALPVPDKKGTEVLMFAGEGTHSTLFSTVHGAIETGYREADRLINNHYKSTMQCRVLIIGAGIAGLGSAMTLHENEFDDFLIVEGRSEVGGRIRTVFHEGQPVELGAQWIHGKGNALYKIAQEEGLLSGEESQEGEGIYVRLNGSCVDKDVVKKVDWEVGKILEECEKFVENNRYNNCPESIGQYLEEKFNLWLEQCGDDEETRQIKLELFDWHKRFQIIDNSCKNLNQLSAKWWGSYQCQNPGYYNLKNGYKSLVDVLQNRIPKEKFKFNTKVIEINYESNQMEVVCENGLIKCDFVILTIPLGVLTKFKIKPELPRSVYYVGFHGIGKIFLFFDENWWGHRQGFQLVFAENFINLLPEEQWVKNLTGFDVVYNNSKVLLGWVGGEGLQLMEELSDQVVGKICVKTLRRFLPEFTIPEPVKTIRTRWLSDEFAHGSYCHIPPYFNQEVVSPLETLSNPISINGIPRLLLAGEAVHSSAYSTTHGAFESGQKQARNLLDTLKKKKCNL